MPTTRYYKTRQTSVADFIVDFTRWLVDDHATLKGPRWELVEARDQAAGTPRQVPTQARGHGTFASLPSGFSWRDGDIQTGDWLVLRSVTRRGRDTFGQIEFQVYISYENATTMGILLIPLNNFTVGGPDGSPPTFPATAFGDGAFGTRVTMPFVNAPGDYYSVADEGMFTLVMDNGSVASTQFTYVGEVDGAQPGDTRPYVIWDAPELARLELFTDGILDRLSPVDNVTLLTLGSPCWWRERNNTVNSTPTLSNRPESRIMPTGPFFSNTSHRHVAGFFRNVYLGTSSMGLRGELSNRQFIYFCNELGSTNSVGIVLKWDGVTAVT